MKKNAKEIAEIVNRMFDRKAIVIVVFPEINHLYWGLEYLITFENEIQQSHADISIGREKIHFYLFLDEESMSKIESELKLQEDNKLISIAANKNGNFYNFASKKWSNGGESVSHILIHEADTVEIQLNGKCATTGHKLTVGGLNQESVANKMRNVVEAEGQTHPHQILRIRLPNNCKTHLIDIQLETEKLELIQQFTDELIKNLNNQHVYGMEPRAVLYFASKNPPDDGFPKHAWIKMEADYKEDKRRSYLALFNNIEKEVDCIIDTNHQTFKKTVLSDIKSLSIEVHCHGKYQGIKTVCESNAKTLAKQLHKIVPTKADTQIILYVCNAGTKDGQIFVDEFLKNIKKKINVQEVIHFKAVIAQHISRPQAIVVKKEKYKNSMITLELIDKDVDGFGAKDVNFAFGRFTTKHIKINNVYKSIPTLPKTEYDLIFDS